MDRVACSITWLAFDRLLVISFVARRWRARRAALVGFPLRRDCRTSSSNAPSPRQRAEFLWIWIAVGTGQHLRHTAIPRTTRNTLAVPAHPWHCISRRHETAPHFGLNWIVMRRSCPQSLSTRTSTSSASPILFAISSSRITFGRKLRNSVATLLTVPTHETRLSLGVSLILL